MPGFLKVRQIRNSISYYGVYIEEKYADFSYTDIWTSSPRYSDRVEYLDCETATYHIVDDTRRFR